MTPPMGRTDLQTVAPALAAGHEALRRCAWDEALRRCAWDEARAAFEEAVAAMPSGEAWEGLLIVSLLFMSASIAAEASSCASTSG